MIVFINFVVYPCYIVAYMQKSYLILGLVKDIVDEYYILRKTNNYTDIL